MNQKTFVGIQVGAISFVDEGLKRVLDLLQEKAGVNALLISALSWSRGNAGRPDPSWGYPDHGIAEDDSLIGGAFFEPAPKYYRNTFIQDFRAPDKLYAGFDVLGDVTPEARKRGMEVYAYYCETAHKEPRPPVVNFPQLLEVDIYGRRAYRPCLRNPAYRAWMFSVVENILKEYDVTGIVWGIERQSGLMNMVDGEAPTCFCEYCREEAFRRGINVDKAREGYRAIHELLSKVQEDNVRFPDGYFVTFLRTLLNYPEVLQWEKMWTDAHKALYQEIYGIVKFIDPNRKLGLSIWQEIDTFNPYLRAQYDFSELPNCADWVKPVLYHVPAGLRFARFAKKLSETFLKDLPYDECVEVLKRVLHLNEAKASELPASGFSADYVRYQTERWSRTLQGRIPVYPGIGVGVANVGGKSVTPEDVRAGVRAAFEGGATGIVICRNYSEMMLANLGAVGETLRALGKL